MPIIPAICPKRKATYKITSKNRNGTIERCALPEKTGIKHPATAVHDAAPRDERNQPITCRSYFPQEAGSILGKVCFSRIQDANSSIHKQPRKKQQPVSPANGMCTGPEYGDATVFLEITPVGATPVCLVEIADVLGTPIATRSRSSIPDASSDIPVKALKKSLFLRVLRCRHQCCEMPGSNAPVLYSRSVRSSNKPCHRLGETP